MSPASSTNGSFPAADVVKACRYALPYNSRDMSNDTDAVLDRLHRLAHWLGSSAHDFSILAEGNVSAAVGDRSTFWLKASGCMMGSMRRDQFVLMDTPRSLAILDHASLTDTQIKDLLRGARVNPDDPLHPSVEAALHAVCDSLAKQIAAREFAVERHG